MLPRFLAIAILAVLVPTAASADEPRPVPDYDGRPDESPNVGEVLIWVPRVVLLPGYIVTEYVVRQPLGAFLTWLEQKKVVQQAYSIFTFGSEGKFGIFPTGLFDFGLRPSVGLYAFVDPLFHPDNRFRVSAAYGGEDWLSLSAKDRIILADDDGGDLSLRGGYSRRPDFPFYGIGRDAITDDETFYRLSRWEIALAIGLRAGDHVGFSSEMRYAEDVREPSDYDNAPQEITWYGRSLSQYLADHEVADFDSGRILEQRLALYADTRGQGPIYLGSGTGARLDVRGGIGFDPADAETQRWIRYGGEASLFLDVTGTRRVFGLNVSADLVDPLSDDAVPVTALVALGGLETMRAFYDGRFLGQSGVTATLNYRWPVASFLDTELFASVGNVFGHHLEDFDLDKLVGSGGFALRTNTSRDLSFDILIALGTRQFDDPSDNREHLAFRIDSVRFAIGTNKGF